MNHKQKQFVLLGILGAVLLLGIFALQNRFNLFNRASSPSGTMCSLHELKCILKNPTTSGDFEISMNVQFKDGTSTTKSVTFAKGFTPPATVSYTPTQEVEYYHCFAKYTNSDKEGMCVASQAYSPSQCSPSLTPEACMCKPGMECDPEKGAIKEELYVGEDGPGLIILNPKITDNGACYECKKIKVFDTKQKKYIEEYDCPAQPNSLLFPVPTGIRLHQADGEQCREYVIEQWASKTGEANPTLSPIKCDTCNEKICCPACKPPVEIGDGCQPFLDAKGEEQQCDFTLSVNQCIQINKSVSMVIKNRSAGVGYVYKVNWDDINNGQNVDVPVPPDTNLVHTYADAGVYDISLKCLYNAGTVEGVKECKKRYSASCTPTTTNTGTPPVTTVTQTPTPTKTQECPWNPNDLQVHIECPNCKLTGTPGVGTGTPGVGTGTPGVGTGTPGVGTGTPGVGTGTPGVGTGTPGAGTGTPGVGTGTATPSEGRSINTSTPKASVGTSSPTTALPKSGTVEISLLLVAIGVLVVAIGFVL